MHGTHTPKTSKLSNVNPEIQVSQYTTFWKHRSCCVMLRQGLHPLIRPVKQLLDFLFEQRDDLENIRPINKKHGIPPPGMPSQRSIYLARKVFITGRTILRETAGYSKTSLLVQFPRMFANQLDFDKTNQSKKATIFNKHF